MLSIMSVEPLLWLAHHIWGWNTCAGTLADEGNTLRVTIKARDMPLDPKESKPLVMKTIVGLVTGTLEHLGVQKARNAKSIALNSSQQDPICMVIVWHSLDSHRNDGFAEVHAHLDNASEVILGIGATPRCERTAMHEGKDGP